MLLKSLSCGEQGYGVVRELENVATEEGDKPTHECFVKDCGELPSDADLTPPAQVCGAMVPTQCHHMSDVIVCHHTSR